MKTLKLIKALAAISFVAWSSNCLAASSAGELPARDIRFIVPWNAGGSADLSARLLSKLFNAEGIHLIVENVPGATGSIGLNKVAAAKPDGSTLGIATTSQLALVAQGLTKTKNSDFAYLNQITTDNYILVVPKDGPATLQEFLEKVKRNPNRLSVGTAGGNNVPHILTVATGHMAGAGLIHVPYTGAAKTITDLAGDQIDAAILKPSESKSMLEAGLLKAIAVYSDSRVPSLPDVPTFKEKGLNPSPWGSIASMSWVVAPAGLPPAMQSKLMAAFAKIVQSPEYKKYALDNGFVAPSLSGDALYKEVQSTQKTLDQVAPRVFTKK